MRINSPAASAADTYPVAVSIGQVSDLYDNNAATRVLMSGTGSANGLVVEFPFPVSARDPTLQKPTTGNISYAVYVWIDGVWQVVGSPFSGTGSVSRALAYGGQAAVSDRFMLTKSTSAAFYIEGLRIGEGGIYPLP